MNTIRMKALKAFPYAGRRLQRDQEFQARGRSDARVLAAVGHAVLVPVAPAAVSAPYTTRAMAATPAPVVQPPADGDLEAMDATALHALAKQLGVKVHHLAGAAKVREAIFESKKAA